MFETLLLFLNCVFVDRLLRNKRKGERCMKKKVKSHKKKVYVCECFRFHMFDLCVWVYESMYAWLVYRKRNFD